MDDITADWIISQLLFLDAEDSEKDIKLFINSPGGSVTAGTFNHIMANILVYASVILYSGFVFACAHDSRSLFYI